jgi:hypothetical protein
LPLAQTALHEQRLPRIPGHEPEETFGPSVHF